MIQIRVATIGDCRTVEALVEAAYAPYVPRIGRKPGPMLDDYPRLIQESRVYVLVVEEIIFGILVLVPQAGSMLLDNVAVSPEAQGRGYGRMLLKFAEDSVAEAVTIQSIFIRMRRWSRTLPCIRGLDSSKRTEPRKRGCAGST
jgi:N-acetylglutamate synthase-like GNAT family acetyltransferase